MRYQRMKKRINITINKHLLDDADAYCKELQEHFMSFSRSRLIEVALYKLLKDKDNEKNGAYHGMRGG